MKDNTGRKRKEKLRADKRRLQNPYAHVEELHEDEDFMDRVHATRNTLQNPYALNEYLVDHHQQANTHTTRPSRSKDGRKPSAAATALRGVSKREFQQRSRQILSGYAPAGRRNRLRNHHREFITRNESRPGQERAALLAQLEKYDLCTTPGVTTYLNRERDTFTKSKLQHIEQSVDSEPSDDHE